MARFRLSRPAQADLAHILATSAERWGIEATHRYAAILAAAMRKVAADPDGPTTRGRAELSKGIRSFHIRHAFPDDPNVKVRHPVHVLYYRAIRPGLIEIVRVLHERMELGRHVGHSVDGDRSPHRRRQAASATARIFSCTPVSACNALITPSRFSAVGLPSGPNMRIRLLGGLPSTLPSRSKPIVALM